MLIFAKAGSLTPNLTIAQIARVERTVRELDPPDLVLLRRLADMAHPRFALRPGQDIMHEKQLRRDWEDDANKQATNRHAHWQDMQPSGHILAAAGRVFTHTYNRPGLGRPSKGFR